MVLRRVRAGGWVLGRWGHRNRHAARRHRNRRAKQSGNYKSTSRLIEISARGARGSIWCIHGADAVAPKLRNRRADHLSEQLTIGTQADNGASSLSALVFSQLNSIYPFKSIWFIFVFPFAIYKYLSWLNALHVVGTKIIADSSEVNKWHSPSYFLIVSILRYLVLEYVFNQKLVNVLVLFGGFKTVAFSKMSIPQTNKKKYHLSI